MNLKNTRKRLRERLIDAQDGLLSRMETERLERQARTKNPQLWKDHRWMMSRSGRDVSRLFADMRTQQPDAGAIARFYQRREAEGGSYAALEHLVWQLFRRYVLTLGMVLIMLLTGLRMGYTEDATPADFRDEMARYLGLDQQQVTKQSHWLYEDL